MQQTKFNGVLGDRRVVCSTLRNFFTHVHSTATTYVWPVDDIIGLARRVIAQNRI